MFLDRAILISKVHFKDKIHIFFFFHKDIHYGHIYREEMSQYF